MTLIKLLHKYIQPITLITIAVALAVTGIVIDNNDATARMHRVCDLAAIDSSYIPQCIEAQEAVRS